MKNILNTAAPFIIALSSCTTETGEFSHPTEAPATSHPSSIGQLSPHLEKQKVAKTRCEIGDEVWATLAERFSCKELQPSHLHDVTTKRSFEFIEKITSLLAMAQITQHPAPVSSSNFLSMVFTIGDANGKHDSLEVYYNNYEAKAYLYLDAHPVEYGGTVGKEFYSFSLSANEATVHHMVNGMGCVYCSMPDFKLDDPSQCGEREMSSVTSYGTYYSDLFIANGTDSQLTCSGNEQEITSTCATTKSAALGSCKVDNASGNTFQTVSEQAPVQAEVFQLNINAITASFVALMHQHGVDVPTEFEK